MPRSLAIGNGHLQVNFDTQYGLRDLFFPAVGQENHLAGEDHRTGCWSHGRFAWVEDSVWEKRLEYLKDTLVTNVRLYHPHWKLEVVFNDAIDPHLPLFPRRVKVINHDSIVQEVRAFFHYDFHTHGMEVGDTILYDPKLQSILAYRGRRYFPVSVENQQGTGIRFYRSWRNN